MSVHHRGIHFAHLLACEQAPGGEPVRRLLTSMSLLWHTVQHIIPAEAKSKLTLTSMLPPMIFTAIRRSLPVFLPGFAGYFHSGVSIEFEVGRKKVGDGIDKGPQFFARGVWGHAPQKNLKSGNSETLYPAFWESNCAGINISMIS